MNLIEHKYLSFDENDDNKTLDIEWKGLAVNDVEYRQIQNDVLALIIHNSATQLNFNLSSLNQYISAENQNWTLSEWLPKLYKTDIKNITVEIPKKVLGQVSVKNIYGDASSNNLKIHFTNSNLMKNKYLSCNLNDDCETMNITWKAGIVTDTEYRTLHNDLLDFIHESNVSHLNLNLSNLNQVFALESIIWTLNEWLPNLSSTSVESIKIEIPQKIMGQISIKSTYGSVKSDKLKIYFVNSN